MKQLGMWETMVILIGAVVRILTIRAIARVNYVERLENEKAKRNNRFDN